MTSNTHAIARHRAEVQRSAHLSSIARAVSDNAGGVGRQAAVIAAASGLVRRKRGGTAGGAQHRYHHA
jgi:hypothetical protein